jgi:hypothetical protein
MFCVICGSFIINKRLNTFYCSSNCRNYNKFKNALEKSIINLPVMYSEHKKIIRGDLFAISNILTNSTTKNKEVKYGKYTTF